MLQWAVLRIATFVFGQPVYHYNQARQGWHVDCSVVGEPLDFMNINSSERTRGRWRGNEVDG